MGVGRLASTGVLLTAICVSAAAKGEMREVVRDEVGRVLEIAWSLGHQQPPVEDLTSLVNDLRRHDPATLFGVLADAHARCEGRGWLLPTVESLASALAGRPYDRPGGMVGHLFHTFEGHVLVTGFPAGGSCGGPAPDFSGRTLRDVVGDDPEVGPWTRPNGKALLRRYLGKHEFIADRIGNRCFQVSVATALGLAARKDLDLRDALLDAKSPYGQNEYVAWNGKRVLLLALGVLRARESVSRLTSGMLAALPGAEGEIVPREVRHLGQALRLAGGEGLIRRLRADVAATRPAAQRRAFDAGVQGEAVARSLLRDLAKQIAADDVRTLTWVVKSDLATPTWKTFVDVMDWAAARIEATEGEERDRARILLHAGHWSFNGNPVRVPGPDTGSLGRNLSVGIGGYPDGLTLHRRFREDLKAGRIRLTDEPQGLPDFFGERVVRRHQAWRDPDLRVDAVREGACIRVTLVNGGSEALWVNPVALRYASAWVGVRRSKGTIRFANLCIRLGHIAHNHTTRYPASVLEKLPPGGDFGFTYPLEERFSRGGIKVSFSDWSEFDGEVPGPVLASFRETIVGTR
jgi:hypothetical protein